jgi:hypothetical protein
MKKLDFEKFVELNIETYNLLGQNKTTFAEFLRNNCKELQNSTIEAVRQKVKAYFKEHPTDYEVPIFDAVNVEREMRAEKSQINDLRKKNEYLLKSLEESEKKFDDLLNIKKPIEILNFSPSGKSNKMSRAIPIISASDWHIEEKVEFGVVNGFNEYSLKIAEQRGKKFFTNLLKVNSIFSKDVNINDLVIWLGGDFISGYIHDELIENNHLSPLEATRMAKRMILSGIRYILDNTKLNLIIPCSVGNHGRNTKKMQPSTGYKNNYEFMMYMDLQDIFDGNKRVKFHIPISDDCYIETLGYINRFFHGNQIKYGGGIGGLSVPLIKYIHRKNQQQQADMNFLGHFHQLLYPTSDSCVNGSLIGLSAYGYQLGFKPETPSQAYTLLDEKRGYTIKTPIFCD